jgi:hypothetical protein
VILAIIGVDAEFKNLYALFYAVFRNCLLKYGVVGEIYSIVFTSGYLAVLNLGIN